MHYGETFRFNGKCACGSKFSALVTVVKAGPPNFIAYRAENGTEYAPAPDGSHRIIWVCQCGTRRYGKPVIGKYNAAKECNAKCMASNGFVCECQCGGKNHGASHG